MKEEQDYIKDIAEIRSMMERSTKFLSLAGLSGILAGVYALTGAYIAYTLFGFNPDTIAYESLHLNKVLLVAIGVMIMAIGTAAFLSSRKAEKNGEKIWNATARRLVINMAVPLMTGGLLIIIMIDKGFIGLLAPITLIFYGLALYNASKFTYNEMRALGLIEIVLGLISSYFLEYSLLFWAIGFGAVHIVYGIYLHYKYER